MRRARLRPELLFSEGVFVANLFIAYDLIPPGQHYDRVRDKIKSLGKWHQFQYSLFYVSTALNRSDAYAQVRSVMDANDKLAVVEALGATISNMDDALTNSIKAIW
jgi:hypothetical protein